MVIFAGEISSDVGAGGSDTENVIVPAAVLPATSRAVTTTLLDPAPTGMSQMNDWPESVASATLHVSDCTPDTGSSTLPRMIAVVLDGAMQSPSSGE
jgi:hypothetical protein